MVKDYKIVDARPEDADLIAWGIMEAVGEELIRDVAGEKPVDNVRRMFAELASREDSQYSYLNTRILLAPDGSKAGICVSYDGGKLKELRKTFFAAARKYLDWKLTEEEMENFPAETSGEEFYLDSLAILPTYRGRGMGRALIEDAGEKAKETGLPLGLLVADDNPGARGLYESCGFKAAGRRPFAGEEMTNMILPFASESSIIKVKG